MEIKIEVQTAGSKLYNLHFQYPEYMHIYQYYNMNAYPYVLVQTKLVAIWMSANRFQLYA